MTKVTMESVVVWALIAAAVWVLTCVLWRRGRMKASTALALPLFVFYLCFVLTITLIERVPGDVPRYELELLWSYTDILHGRTGLIPEVFWNVVLFFPVGWILSTCLPRKREWWSVVIGMLLSIGIEVTQLITRRGLFEFDDIFNNTLGTLIGWLMYLPWRWLAEAWERRTGGHRGRGG